VAIFSSTTAVGLLSPARQRDHRAADVALRRQRVEVIREPFAAPDAARDAGVDVRRDGVAVARSSILEIVSSKMD